MMSRATFLVTGLAGLLALRAAGQGFDMNPVAWTLPAGGQAITYQGATTDFGFNGPNSYSPYNGQYHLTGSQRWSVTDLNGDTRPDLVVLTQKQADGSFLPFGTAPNRYWKVYAGTSTGFATTAIDWALPAGGYVASFTGTTVDYGFSTLASDGRSSDSDGSQSWSVTDVNGDARPDLVVCSQQTGGNFQLFGTAPSRYWKVYLNTGSGFAATALNWTLPAGGLLYSSGSGTIDYGFRWLTSFSDTYHSAGSQLWSTQDVNGDAKPDLVVFSQRQPNNAPRSTAFLPFGTAPNRYWKVYLNTGSGFATTAIDWPLPTGGLVDTFTGITTDYGFNFPVHEAGSEGDTGSQSWSMTDLNGDARPDLVVLTQRQANSYYLPFGTAPGRYWKAYLNTGSGFASAATDWPLPTGGQLYSTNGFLFDFGFNALNSFTGSNIGSYGGQRWSVADINGDAKPDLVVVSQMQTNNGFLPFGVAPNRYWKVYLNMGSGFATTATNWPLPVGGLVTCNTNDEGFNAWSSLVIDQYCAGNQTWGVRDVNSDAKPDLVVYTQMPASFAPLPFGTAPNRYWKVYLNTATPLATSAAASIADEVQLYPNPTTSQLTLSGPASLAGQPYALLDMLGRTVRAGRLDIARPTLDVQALPAGVYGVRLGPGSRLLRFVKQ